jgi:hypothetical protein
MLSALGALELKQGVLTMAVKKSKKGGRHMPDKVQEMQKTEHPDHLGR